MSTLAGTNLAAYQYDAFGRRVQNTLNGVMTQYQYDGLNPVEEFDGSSPPNVTATMLTGLGIDEYFQRVDSNGALSYLTDMLGSTLALADSSGALDATYTYDPFGNVTVNGADTNPYQFTGRENDGTGLYYYRARYYSPQYQRFVSQDPLGVTGGINLYAYALNDPANLIDPLGLDAYLCDRPIKGAPGEYGPLYHQFICVVLDHATYCFGLTTYNGSLDFPGSIVNVPGSFEPDKPNNSCKRQSTKRCVDSCLLGMAEQPAPDYSLLNVPGGMNCQKFATSAMAYCQAKCADSSN